MNRSIKRIGQIAGALLLSPLISADVFGEDAPKAAPAQTLITNASVFDGKSAKLAESLNVLMLRYMPIRRAPCGRRSRPGSNA